MDRRDILQILVENEGGITAQAVRAEVRGRYGLGGCVKKAIDALVSDGLAVQSEDDEGRRLYAPVMPAAVRELFGGERAARAADDFFG